MPHHSPFSRPLTRGLREVNREVAFLLVLLISILIHNQSAVGPTVYMVSLSSLLPRCNCSSTAVFHGRLDDELERELGTWQVGTCVTVTVQIITRPSINQMMVDFSKLSSAFSWHFLSRRMHAFRVR